MQSILQKTTGIGPQVIKPEHLEGRVAIVTGGALGIGYEVSRALAHAGCKVIMINRKEEQGDEAISTIQNEKSDAKVDWKECDMGNLAQIREVFGGLRESLDRLDFLLWPLLRKTGKMENTPPPRVVFEASEMHRLAQLSNIQFRSKDEINDPNLDSTARYNRTKLAMILFAKYGLAGKVIQENNDRIYALSVHPGAVNTAMQQQWKDAYPGLTGKLLSWAMLAIGRDVEQGSYSALWALTSPKIEEEDLNGYYFSDPDQEGKETSQASNPELASNLWNLSVTLIEGVLGSDALLDWNVSTVTGGDLK
ncbi:short-chain dehydrogenase TIC 32 chloroplastic [Fusarium pseudoanthophilum]|uniref:Short-chain dehydrogenase TIC 32 chloroplastic n=1 Tax=Fusarium pseudoanthophilum TaxID=48495 RepID=A0A8H5P5L3_9HYPO|nr:short-chain dehydrogenase TIC 32 chloroplastic [Fusarium pseudoanthophilum]